MSLFRFHCDHSNHHTLPNNNDNRSFEIGLPDEKGRREILLLLLKDEEIADELEGGEADGEVDGGQGSAEEDGNVQREDDPRPLDGVSGLPNHPVVVDGPLPHTDQSQPRVPPTIEKMECKEGGKAGHKTEGDTASLYFESQKRFGRI